eukprot:2027100-Rhodomonas_salina.5
MHSVLAQIQRCESRQAVETFGEAMVAVVESAEIVSQNQTLERGAALGKMTPAARTAKTAVAQVQARERTALGQVQRLVVPPQHCTQRVG